MDDSKDGGGLAASSTRPYLIRALHEWCTDNGFTPYVAVHVDRTVQVPMEYVSNNEIVLNVGFDATSNLDLGNELIQFKARFGGVAREIIVPVDLCARERPGHGLPAAESGRRRHAPAGAERAARIAPGVGCERWQRQQQRRFAAGRAQAGAGRPCCGHDDAAAGGRRSGRGSVGGAPGAQAHQVIL